MTDLTLFPEYPNLVKIPLVEEEKTVFYISYAYPNEGDPKRFLAPLLNGQRSVKNKEAGVKQTNRKCLE